ncbi:MAG: undecaprenyl-diphosphate phosphatase [Clostridiales Family XIII bacterium]|jgi:undecaprenyl-diphosphatase|nr:undecaprenyl-diphosphate phosphatase [Clostridiales Family XIII bacterium]
MTIFESAVLGLLQGLAEFLPISSSGHLALLEHFFGIEGEKVLSFAVLLHVGTLISIFAVYRKDIWELIVELGAVFKDIFTGRGLMVNKNDTRRLGFMIIVATIPTVIAGFTLRDTFALLYANIPAIGAALIVTGTMMFFAERGAYGARGLMEMKFSHAILVGVLQSVALCPGISRSGATIVGGLVSGLNREFAVRFAFLISIPSVIGAVILEAPEAFKGGIDTAMLLPIVLGVALAAIAGFIAIKAMIRVVSGKKLYYFSIYTWILGAGAIVYALFFI